MARAGRIELNGDLFHRRFSIVLLTERLLRQSQFGLVKRCFTAPFTEVPEFPFQKLRCLDTAHPAEALGINGDLAGGFDDDFDLSFHSHASNGEFDASVLERLPLDDVTPTDRFAAGFVDGVELQQTTEVLADFTFDVAVPPIGSEFVGALGITVQRDVVGTCEPNDEIAVTLGIPVATGVGVVDELETQLAASGL